MHLPGVFSVFTYSGMDIAGKGCITFFFFPLEGVVTLNLGFVNTKIAFPVQRIQCPACSNLDYIPVRMWQRCY